MGNVLAAFQTKLTPTYKPMDCFQNGLEGKQQGEQVDLWKVFPRKFHSEFHRNLLYRHVCFYLSFILVLTAISVSKGHEYWKIKFILLDLLMSWTSNLRLLPQIICTSQLAAWPLPWTCWVGTTSQPGTILQPICPNPLPGLSRPARYQGFILE